MTVHVHIENIFPIPIYISDIDVSDVNVDHIQMRPNGPDDIVTLSETDFLLDDPQYSVIKDQIDEHMNHYYHGILQYDRSVYPVMVSSWVVKSLPNQESSWHIHSNSFFSGVLYLTDDPNSGNITFKKELEMLNPLYPPIATKNFYNNRVFSLRPKKGLLVMFPSTLSHKVEKNLSDTIRISIAFNYFLKGKFTEKTSTLEIK